MCKRFLWCPWQTAMVTDSGFCFSSTENYGFSSMDIRNSSHTKLPWGPFWLDQYIVIPGSLEGGIRFLLARCACGWVGFLASFLSLQYCLLALLEHSPVCWGYIISYWRREVKTMKKRKGSYKRNQSNILQTCLP